MDEDIKYVIDSSFMLAHLLPDEKVSQVDKVFMKYAQGKVFFSAPYILPFEVINGLRSAAISKRIDKNTAQILIDDFLTVKIEFQKVNFKRTLAISFQNNCSIYDASYITLSQDKNLHLLALDEKLRKLTSRKN
jgi:predicted nucleic acid-binding protein